MFFLFKFLLVWMSQWSFHEFSCREQKERLVFGIRKVISQDHCYAGSRPPLILRHLYVSWGSKHSLQATSWREGKDVCCLTSRIQLHISHAIIGDKNHHRTGCYPPGTWCNLPVTTIFNVVAAHLYKSHYLCTPTRTASKQRFSTEALYDILCKLSLVQKLVSKRYEYTHN